MALIAACLGIVLWSGDRGWVAGMCAALIGVRAAQMVAAYVLTLRRSLAVMRRMDAGQATLRLGDDTLEVASAAGRVELPWATVREVDVYPDVWLLMYAGEQFGTLPSADLPDEARALIAERVRLAGGGCRNAPIE